MGRFLRRLGSKIRAKRENAGEAVCYLPPEELGQGFGRCGHQPGQHSPSVTTFLAVVPARPGAGRR